MTLKGIYSYKNLDSSADYNARSAKILSKGIFDGGSLVYTGSLIVNISPFIAHGADGLVIISDALEPLTVIDGQINYLICHAQYVSTSSPFIEMRVIGETEWSSSPNKEYFITFCKFDLTTGGPFGAVTASEADYSTSDFTDKAGLNEWRRAAATQATLPTAQNKEGDTRIALDDRIAYTWNGTTKTWVPLKTKASSVTSLPYGAVTATDVQAAIQQLATLLSVSSSAAAVSVTPAGDISSVTVQTALEELDTEKAGLASLNTFTAKQTVSAAGLDTVKLSLNNTSTGTSTQWAKHFELVNLLNKVRFTTSGSAAAETKRFQISLNANFSSSSNTYTADNPGNTSGYEAGIVRYTPGSNTLTIGQKSDTISAWSDAAWTLSNIVFPSTSLDINLNSDGTWATDNTITLADRVIYSTYADNTFVIYVPFTRKFTTAPSGVNIATILAEESEVLSATVTDITEKGFTVSIVPNSVGMITFARDWVTL